MTDVAGTAGVLVATGPNDIELSAVGDAKQPTSFSGSGTYTVSNKGPNRLTVLMSGKLLAAPAGTMDSGAPAGSAPTNASVNVTPPRVVLDPGANAQAKADISIPAGTSQTKAMLELFFRDEQKPNEIYARYTSGVSVPSSKKPTNWKLILLILAIVLVVLIGAIVAFFLLKGGGGKTFAIPTVRGMAEADATKTLQESVLGCDIPCFKVESEQVVDADPEIAIGQVLKTEPAVDEKAKRDSTVKLFVLKGVNMPDVTNLTEQAARDKLASACEPSPCFNANPVRIPSFATVAGVVMSSFPTANQTVKKGSSVNLYVSDGSHHLALSWFLENGEDVDVGESPKIVDLSAHRNFFLSPFIRATAPAVFTTRSNAPLASHSCSGGGTDEYSITVLPIGTHLCLRTTAGRNAELVITGLSPSTVTLEYVIWPRSLLDDLKRIPQKEIFTKIQP